MVASKKIHCVSCNKKCSGNVLRYQDQYYHKQCFEFEQAQGVSATGYSGSGGVDDDDGLGPHNTTTGGGTSTTTTYNASGSSRHHNLLSSQHQQQQQQQQATTTTKSTNGFSSATAEPSNSMQRTNSPSGQQQQQLRSQTIDTRYNNNHRATNLINGQQQQQQQATNNRSATLPHSVSSPANGFLSANSRNFADCAGCRQKINDGQALIALDLHWHVSCFKCTQCKTPLHAEYVAKDGKAYCEKDYQKLFGVTCVYCKRYITGKVLQAGEAHHFHPSCARCSKCGDPFVPGEEMYLQSEVTWHPRCGPGPDNTAIVTPGGAMDSTGEIGLIEASTNRSQLRSSRAHSPSLSSRSRSASPFSFMSRQNGRSSPGYADSEAVGDLSRIYTISYLNADPTQGYLRRPIEPNPPKSPQFSRPTSSTRDQRSRSSSRSQYGYATSATNGRERSVPRGMYSVLSSMRSAGSSVRARSPSMLNEEAIHMAQYPSGQKPSPDSVPKIERDDFPAPPFPYPRVSSGGGGGGGGGQAKSAASRESPNQNQNNNNNITTEAKVDQRHQQQQQRASRPRSREIVTDRDLIGGDDDDDDDDSGGDPQLKKEEEELSKIANGIGKIFLQTLKEREKLRAWKRANLDPRNASRTPSATRELPSRMRYDNPLNASPSRDMDRPRPWEEDELDHSPTRTRSSLGRSAAAGGGGGGPIMASTSNSALAASAAGAQSQMSPSTYGYKVVQSNRSTPKPGYGVGGVHSTNGLDNSEISFNQQQRIAQNRSTDLLNQQNYQQQPTRTESMLGKQHHYHIASSSNSRVGGGGGGGGIGSSSSYNLYGGGGSSAHFRRSMPNVNLINQQLQTNSLHHLHSEGPPKLYPYHLLATSNYRLPPDVDRCHLERHLSNEEFQYIFHCDRLDFYRLPEWKRNELKRRAKLF